MNPTEKCNKPISWFEPNSAKRFSDVSHTSISPSSIHLNNKKGEKLLRLLENVIV